ncbi:MAG: hypothetical protein JXB88_03800 [Spirochaetales bacterium]|nr:hypothetical protein [Spirochaetales bacterium]
MENEVNKQTKIIDKSYITALIAIIILILSILIVTLVTIIEMLISIIVIFFLLTLIFFSGIWICTSGRFKQHRKDIFLIFCFTLLINVIAVAGSSYLFKYNLGVITGANDEIRSYLEGDMQNKTLSEQNIIIEKSTYPLFLHILTYLSLLAKSLGGNSPFNFKFFSAFFGGCIPVTIFCHFIRKYPIEKVKKTALFSGVFPCFTYFASIGVRDIIIIFITALFFFLLIDKKSIKRTVLILGIILFLYFFRLEQAAFLFATYFSYFIIDSVKKLDYIRIIAIILCSAFLFAAAVQFQDFLIFFIQKQIVEQKERYTEVFLKAVLKKKELESSLTYRIRNLPVPLNYILIFGYNVLSNFPPYLLLESQVVTAGGEGLPRTPKSITCYGRTLKALGPLVWYFVLPYVLLGLFFGKCFNFNEKFIIVFCFLYILGMSIFTTDIGRIVVVYGNMFPFGLMMRYHSSVKSRRKVDVITFIVVALLFVIYFSFKS